MVDYTILTDEELLKEYQREKNAQLLNILFSRYLDVGFRTANRYLRNPSDAEDVLQQSFIKMLQNLHEFRDGSITVKPWLMKIIVNTSLKRIREDKNRRIRHEKVATENYSANMEKEKSNISENEKVELKNKIQKLIDGLPEKYRSPIWLVLYEGFSYPEVASVLSLPEKTVRTQVSRGLEKLRESTSAIGLGLSVALIVSLMSESKLEAAPVTAQKMLESPNLYQYAQIDKPVALSATSAMPIVSKILATFILALASFGGYQWYIQNKTPEIPEASAQTIITPVIPKPQNDLLSQIENLPNNTWMKLPPFKVTGDIEWLKNKEMSYKGPIIRDYCNKIVWASDRKRALYCGGGHTSFIYNDVWEYDLSQNTWECLLANEDVFEGFTKEGSENEVEILRSRIKLQGAAVTSNNGAPIRISNTHCNLTYDPIRHRLILCDVFRGLWATKKDLISKAVDLNIDTLIKKESLLFQFDPEKRKWEPWKDVPYSSETAPLEYIPDQKSLWLRFGKSYMLDESKNKELIDLKESGNGPGLGYLTAYDPESKVIVAVQGKNTFSFSFATNQWQLLHNGTGPYGIIPKSSFCYDSISKKFILVTSETTPCLWVFDLKKNEWSNPVTSGDIPVPGSFICYFDPVHNVTVLYSGYIEDKTRKWSIFVYRHTKLK